MIQGKVRCVICILVQPLHCRTQPGLQHGVTHACDSKPEQGARWGRGDGNRGRARRNYPGRYGP